MTKNALAISLSILACVFLVVLPAVAEDGANSGSGYIQNLWQAILEWIAPPEDVDDLEILPSSPPAASTTNTPNPPEIGGFIPPGG